MEKEGINRVDIDTDNSGAYGISSVNGSTTDVEDYGILRISIEVEDAGENLITMI